MQERILWTAAEYRTLGAELKRRDPKKFRGNRFTAASIKEINAAQEAALPPERRRPINHNKVASVRARIESAILDNADVPDSVVLKKNFVRWTEAEVDRVVAFLSERLGTTLDEQLTGVSMPIFRDVMTKALPRERLRSFPALTNVRATLADAVARARDGKVPRIPAVITSAAPGDEPGAQTVAALAVREAFVGPTEPVDTPVAAHAEPAPERQPKIFTTAAEYVAIAEAIHRQNPFYGWPYKEHLAGLSVEEINAAIREALAPHRRRKIKTVSTVREKLIEAFAVVRARVEAEKEFAKRVDAERIAAQKAADEAKPAEPVPASPEPVSAPAIAPAASAALLPLLAQAVEPFVSALGAHLGKAFAAAFLPALENAMVEVIATVSPTVPTAPPSAPTPPPSAATSEPEDKVDDPLELQPPPNYHGPEGVAPRPPRVAIIGPSSTLSRELENAFPDLEFEFIERGPKGVPEAIQHCDRIIAISNFFNEQTRKAIKSSKTGKAKLTQVDGGTSSVKRALAILINAGDLRVATPRH